MSNVRLFFSEVAHSLKIFTPKERRNIMIYILGIMLYKFGLEAFNGSIISLATNRYDYEALQSGTPSKTFERLGLLTGLNQAFQCVGSIVIAPLVKRFATKNVLTGAIFVFSLFSAILLILDAATGGTIMPEAYRGVGNHPKDDYSYYGDYDTNAIIPIYSFCGITYGMVELIRRVIPRDIVGGDVLKLRKMDSLVHIFYEISGTAGAFCTALVLIPQLGNNMAFIITPICFLFCSITWFFVNDFGFKHEKGAILKNQPGYIKAILGGFYVFGQSIWVGAKILFSSRRFIWLIPSYSIALYAHRYLENGIAPQVARRYLGDSSWSQIMVGGSNLGELLGAFFVFIFTNLIHTPMPWLRLDALMILIVWYIPFWHPPQGDVTQAWIVAATFLPIAFGWAAGDVSLAAYIQACLDHLEGENKVVSALGAVMAFLYSLYIVLYAILGTLLGTYLDGVYESTGGANGGTIAPGLIYTAGVQFTIVAVLVFSSTFVPKGSFAFNPRMLSSEELEADASQVTTAATSPEIKPEERMTTALSEITPCEKNGEGKNLNEKNDEEKNLNRQNGRDGDVKALENNVP